MKLKHFLLMFLYLNTISAALTAKVRADKDIAYTNMAVGNRNLLDVYYPEIDGKSRNVLVFIHGGSWDSGKKNIYWWLGRNFAKKDIVEVNINYRLAPGYQYMDMASDAAAALRWVNMNISRYGGDPERIFVMGHSAGGHLAALINSDPQFFKEQGIKNPIRGVILNDSFGLDMHEYLLTAEKTKQTASFLQTFSTDQEAWKKGSPLSYLSNVNSPHLILVGERTYPAIENQSRRLYELLKANGHPAIFKQVANKKHVGMITQMVSGRNEMYSLIVDFMSANQGTKKPD